jgi:hypothetical protein
MADERRRIEESPLLQLVLRRRREGECGQLEARAILQLEQLGGENRDRVVAEILREIATTRRSPIAQISNSTPISITCGQGMQK